MKYRSAIYRLPLPVPAAEAFRWHERPGALQRLVPPWENVVVGRHTGGIRDGARVELKMRLGPLRLRWIADHRDYIALQQFRDVQSKGPFAHWEHLHRFHGIEQSECILEDRIEYALRGGLVAEALAGEYIKRKIDQTFRYRHAVTAADLELHRKHKDCGSMRVAVTGSSGLVGSSLVPLLTTGGHEVVPIVRREAQEGQVRWNPSGGTIEREGLEGVDAVVHLAGENIAGGRWNAERKARIRSSRVDGTRLLCENLAQLKEPPRVLVSASAVGYYGDRGKEELNEQSGPGTSFLASVAQQWEEATSAAADAGIRVVCMRFGIILSPRGGALEKMLTPFRLGLGGRVGSGEQYLSWVAIDDAVGGIYHAIMKADLAGPVNAVAPNPVTNGQLAKTLARVLSRPAVVPMPAAAARMALGEMADELLLCSARVVPQRLEATGYDFRHPELEGALRDLLGKSQS